jgi:hypothetical protein
MSSDNDPIGSLVLQSAGDEGVPLRHLLLDLAPIYFPLATHFPFIPSV